MLVPQIECDEPPDGQLNRRTSRASLLYPNEAGDAFQEMVVGVF